MFCRKLKNFLQNNEFEYLYFILEKNNINYESLHIMVKEKKFLPLGKSIENTNLFFKFVKLIINHFN